MSRNVASILCFEWPPLGGHFTLKGNAFVERLFHAIVL